MDEVATTCVGESSGFGLHWAQAGTLGLGASIGRGAGDDGFAVNARSLRGARLCTIRHPGGAGPGGVSSIAGGTPASIAGVSDFGRH